MKKKLACVLLVDDDDAANFLARKTIQRAGLVEHIETVLNGKEAITYLTNSGKYEHGGVYPQPSLIFLDINMPVMDGWEFLQAYQNLQDNQKGEIIIVMLSASFNPADKIKALKFKEISGYKTKPLSAEILDEIMIKHFADYL